MKKKEKKEEILELKAYIKCYSQLITDMVCINYNVYKNSTNSSLDEIFNSSFDTERLTMENVQEIFDNVDKLNQF